MQTLRGSGAKQGRSGLGEEHILGRAREIRMLAFILRGLGDGPQQTVRDSQQFILFLIKTFSRTPKEGGTQRNMKNTPPGWGVGRARISRLRADKAEPHRQITAREPPALGAAAHSLPRDHSCAPRPRVRSGGGAGRGWGRGHAGARAGRGGERVRPCPDWTCAEQGAAS